MPARGFKDLQKKLQRLESDLADEVADAAREGAAEIAASAKSNVQAQNAVWRQNLFNSIFVTEQPGPAHATYHIEVDVPYAGFVEFGTGSRRDPTAPPRFTYGSPEHTPELTREIAEWVATKPMFFGPRTEGVAWAIAKTIANKGTHAHPFLRPAWFQGEPLLLQNVRLAFKKEVRRS